MDIYIIYVYIKIIVGFLECFEFGRFEWGRCIVGWCGWWGVVGLCS